MISLFALALPLPSAATVPPPPIVIAPSPAPAPAALLSWTPGHVNCSGTAASVVRIERPWLQRVYPNNAKYAPVSFAFDIDASGRPLAIRKGDAATPYGIADDLGPALAATRFRPGQPKKGCAIVFSPELMPIDDAPLSALMAYSANPVSGPLPPEAWKRIFATGTCKGDSVAGLRNRAFPNFRAIPAEPGVRDWSMVGYDVGQSGASINVETLASSGNAALDEASRAATTETRYWSGAFTGCRFSYWRSAGTLPAPPAPEEDAFRPAGATCPERREWATPPVLRFPEPYRRRAIEGWAVVTYDVAPWGEINNIQVKASQPSADFGAQAVTVLRSARVKPGPGAVGCVERVRFVMESDQAETAP
ncbi:TonB family protein [Blastomonas sp. CCH5-A3]|uniref:energy transducer TonB n=1 Tax=Blastomonas sp. CCH5-A3 TaxID=1768761 RepID=UPI0009E671B5|nr:TonB family protein [Blastomonas sp. CCH5-A3]|tara:strand:+ start:152870 stop:153961 length:1092 start_codon:yes stop_codon:yes gene_type:complete